MADASGSSKSSPTADSAKSRPTPQQARYVATIKEALAQGNLTVVVGAGVSVSALQASKRIGGDDLQRAIESMSWLGVLRHGLAYLEEEEIISSMDEAYGIELEGYKKILKRQSVPTDIILRAASFLKSVLESSIKLANWFDLEFGDIYNKCINQDPNPILDAMKELYNSGARIITTNYDDLLDKHIGVSPIRSDDTPALKLFFQRKHAGICHVHGIWWHSKGAVLDNMDYGRAIADERLQQSLKNSMTGSEVLLFIGTGGGLDDPNFGGLLAWAAKQNEGVAQRHCVLARRGERIDTKLNGLNVLRYGAGFEELPGFLMEIAQANKPSVQPAKHYLVPSIHVANFVGRRNILAKIDDCFKPSRDRLRPTVVVVQAMGGQGKSQLALEYCRVSKPHLRGCFWINASSKSTVEQDFGIIATALNKPQSRLLSDASSKIDFVKEVLENWEDRWILVFDNYDQPTDSHDIRKYWPSRGRGCVLITSRDRDTEELGEPIPLPPMTDEEGLELLIGAFSGDRGSGRPFDRDDALKVISRLGHLPLALAQARAYLKHEKISFQQFLTQYEKEKRNIMEHIPASFWNYRKVVGREEKEKAYSAFTTWEMTFQRVHRHGNGAIGNVGDFLTVCSFLEPSRIGDHLFLQYLHGQTLLPGWIQPFLYDQIDNSSEDDMSAAEDAAEDALLTDDVPCQPLESITQNDPSLRMSKESRQKIQSQIWSPRMYWKQMVELENMSLLNRVSRGDNDNIFISLHPLIRDWLQLRIPKKTQRQHLCDVRDIIYQSMLSSSSTLEQQEELVSHMQAFLFYDEHILESKSTLEFAREEGLADCFVTFYQRRGRRRDAHLLAKRVLQERKQCVGAEHPFTILAMGNLARTYAHMGEMEKARELDEEAVKLLQKESGLEHPHTLLAMGNLAATYADMGKMKEARGLVQEVFNLLQRVSGPEHPYTLVAMGNLARISANMGEMEEARKLEEKVLELRQRVSGPEHPYTLVAMGNLARMYANMGKMEKARELEEKALEVLQRVSGPEHPDTIHAMGNLATTYADMGEMKKARKLEEDVVELQQKLSGPEHPDTILAMGNLASIYADMDEMKTARELKEKVLKLRQKVSGREHPDTIIAMGNLAVTYANMGQTTKARDLMEKVLERRQNVLGPMHPSTILAMGNLARVSAKMGKIEEARELEEKVLELRQRVSGPEHPYTLVAMGNLARTYANMDKMEKARELEEKELELLQKVFGPEHRSTILAMGNLATTYADMGKMEEARELEEKVLELLPAILEPCQCPCEHRRNEGSKRTGVGSSEATAEDVWT